MVRVSVLAEHCPLHALGILFACQMKNMKAEDWDRAKQQISGMSTEELARQANQAQSQLSAQQKYVLDAAVQLKNQGNSLHGAGKYAEAVEKYDKARTNVDGHSSTEAAELRKACMLNLSSCYLNLKRYDKCVEECNQVLTGEAIGWLGDAEVTREVTRGCPCEMRCLAQSPP